MINSIIRKLFRWRQVPPPPLETEELMKIEMAFMDCNKECPVAIMFQALMGHIRWQEEHLKIDSEGHKNYF